MSSHDSATTGLGFGGVLPHRAERHVALNTSDPVLRAARRTPRRLVAGCLVLGSAVLTGTLIGLWNWQGWVVPVRIAEASMAPNFCGDHWLVHCPHCQKQFAIDAASPRHQRWLICPQCRRPLNRATQAEFRRGQRVLIHRSHGADDDPRRWDVWALRHPMDDDRLLVKRVVGLPGERVALRAGDVFVNGRILRKSLAELRQLAILVTDDRFGPDAQANTPHATGWQWESKPGGWRLTRAGLEFSGARQDLAPEARCSWLHHARGGETTRAWIGDDYVYNSALSRQLNLVTDLLLQCELTADFDAELAFQAQTPDGTWSVTWRVRQRRLELRQDGRLLARSTQPPTPPSNVYRAEFGFCDQQILFGVDGQQWVRFSCPEPADGVVSHGQSTRLALGARAGPVVIHRLRVVRDVYYERPQGPRAWPLPTTLAAGQFFLLGDNSPCSVDSRHRALGPVGRERLIGSVRTLGGAGSG